MSKGWFKIIEMLVALVVSTVAAFIVQSFLAEIIMRMSEWLYPGQMTTLGDIAYILVPHPLFFGLYLLPVMALGIFFVYVFFRRRVWGSNSTFKREVSID